MLCSITLTAETTFPQIGGFAHPLKASTEYLMNTINIMSAKTYNTTQSEFEYCFNTKTDRASYATFRCTSSVATLQGVAQSASVNRLISLTVTEDYDGTEVSETRVFNQDMITLVYLVETGKTAIVVNAAGATEKTYIVSDTLAQIITKSDA